MLLFRSTGGDGGMLGARGLVLAAALLAPACGERPANAVGVQRDSGPAVAALAHTTADGNRMPYKLHGEGDVTVLLVHCWMCDRTFWEAQIPVLAERYRTIAIDLPGHGLATGERAEWNVAAYGADVAGFIEALDLRDVVLVGHSMGGPVSLRAAALAGVRVLGIVAVDTLHDAEFVFPEEQMQSFLAAFEADFPGTCNAFVAQMFPEQNAEAAKTHVQSTNCGAERSAIGIALLEDIGTIDMQRWFSEAGVPIRAINAAQPNPTRIETNRKYADFDAVLMQGVGHYPHMSRPDAFNLLLLDVIAELTNAAQ